MLGETEEDKYGSEPQRPAAPVRGRDRVGDGPGLRAPLRRRALLGARLARRPARGPRPGRRRPARRRRCRLLLPRRGAARRERRPGHRPLAADRLGAERAAGRDRRPRRRPGRRHSPTPTCSATTASPTSTTARSGSTSSTGRLSRRSRARSPSSPRPPRRARNGRSFATRSRSCASPRSRTARSTPRRTTRRALARADRDDRRVRAGPRRRLRAPGGLHRGALRRPRRVGRVRLRASPPSTARWRRFGPSATAATGSSTSCVFPMYKQNASTDTCFEALIVRVPWPEWIDELERTRYDNAKFLPVTFVDHTSGYDSECAVLFPETFSTAERPSDYHFGAIFCDREAERFRRVCGAAAETLRLNLPPDAACLLVVGRALARRLHALGPDPRPHPHARRPALRPVHDPPAQPVLDVLARGAALRPDRVRARR